MQLDYWQKQTRKKPLYPDLLWNLPEQKQGSISVIGGNSQSFASAYRTSEYLQNHFTLKTVQLVLPDALRGSLPPLSNITFTPSTDSGSFAKSSELRSACSNSETGGTLPLLIGDFSKNSATTIALLDAIQSADKNDKSAPVPPLLITRDGVDLLTPEAQNFIHRQNLTLVASAAQLQKLFRALYYPKMILLSQPLTALLEALHKFTLSYPCALVTYHAEQIIVANNGAITTTPISDTRFTPLSLWNGQLAANIAVFQLFNPGKPLEATTAAILYE